MKWLSIKPIPLTMKFYLKKALQFCYQVIGKLKQTAIVIPHIHMMRQIFFLVFWECQLVLKKTKFTNWQELFNCHPRHFS